MSESPKPPKSLLRAAGRAIADFSMIHHGDRLLLGLSGGKDSLSLLHLLRHFQRHAPIEFQLAAVTVDPQIEGYHPEALKPYLAALGVPYFYESHPLAELAAEHMEHDSFCAFCSRMKRGIMYRVAREQGCNVLVLGQHLDDLAESFLMSAFRGGRLKTMKAHYLNDAGDIRVIRPLVYARERQTAAFATEAGLPVVPDSCPACFSMPTEREHTKGLLAAEEARNPGLFKSLLSAMRPLMSQGLEAALAVCPSDDGQRARA